jgi:hypothetical protein
MFDETENSKLLVISLADLSIVATEPTDVKGRGTLIFTYQGDNYQVPDTYLPALSGQNNYLWRIDSGAIAPFKLVLASPRLRSVGRIVGNTPSILS